MAPTGQLDIQESAMDEKLESEKKEVRKIVFLVSAILILVGIIIYIVVRSVFQNTEFFISLLIFVAHCLIVIGVTLLITETAWFRRYTDRVLERFFARSEKTFQRYAQKTIEELGKIRDNRDGFLTTAKDVSFLEKNFSPAALKDIRVAITEALCRSPVDKSEGSFLSLIEDRIYPMLDKPLRYDYEIFLEHKVMETPDKLKVIQVNERCSWRYVNLSSRKVKISQPFENVMKKIRGVDPSMLRVLKTFQLNGNEVDLRWQKKSESAEQVIFEAYYDIECEAEDVEVFIEQEKILPYNDHFRTWMKCPTKGVSIEYAYPKGFSPELTVFGFGGERALREQKKSETLTSWSYSGWLLENHGIILYWC